METIKNTIKDVIKAKQIKKSKKQALYLHAGMLLTIEEVKSYNLANERSS